MALTGAATIQSVGCGRHTSSLQAETLTTAMAPVPSGTSNKRRRTHSDTLPRDGAQPKPLGEFHYFLRLPPELRVIVWKMALHPWGAKRGVQYLSLFKSTGDRKSPLLDLAIPNRRFSEYKKKYEPFLLNIEYRVAAPRVSAHGNHAHGPEYSWLKDNRSLYAWGAGLSSACRESRWIFREFRRHPDGRVIKRRKTQKTRKTQFDRDLERLENRSRKLFCLEFEREDIEASMTISWGVLLRQLPLSPGNSSPFNIAFEFHPSWVTSLPDEREPFDLHQEPSPRGLVARIFEAWCRRDIDSHVTVWLIDRSIRVGRGSGVRFYSSSVFADLQHTYVAFESRDVFYGAGKTKRERDTAFYLCKRLNIRKKVDSEGTEAELPPCFGLYAD